MDNLTNIEDIKSLVDDVDNFFTDPNFKPKEQNKYFFSEGTSYYKQLLQVCNIIKLLQTSIKSIYDNQEKIKSTIDDLNLDDFKDIPSRVDELETKATDLINRVTALENDNTSNKARITNNEQAIDLLKSRVNTNETSITSINTAMTSLNNIVNTFENRIGVVEQDVRDFTDNFNSQVENIKSTYLKDIDFTSTDIEFTEVSKENGVKNIQAVIVSATPIDFGKTLTYIKEQNANIVNKVGEVTITTDEENKTIVLSYPIATIENGNLVETTNNVVKLNSDNFNVSDEGIISTNIDLTSVETKVNENKTAIDNNKSSIEQLQTDLATTNSNVTNNATAINNNSNDIAKVESNLATTNSNVTATQTRVQTLEEEYQAQQETLSDYGTLISNNQGNIATNSKAIDEIKTHATITDNNVTTNADNIQQNRSLINTNTSAISTNLSLIKHLSGYWCTKTVTEDSTTIEILYSDFSDLEYDSTKDYILDTMVYGSDNLINIESMTYNDEENKITITFDTAITSNMKVTFNLREVGSDYGNN